MEPKVQALLEKMKEQALVDVKTLAKNQVEVAYDVAFELAAEKLKAVIPGNWDDAVIEVFIKTAAPLLKTELLKALDQIHEAAPAQA